MGRKETIKARQGRQKTLLLEQLRKTPVIETACQKTGVPRSTVYRWMKKSKTFARQIEVAMSEGRKFMIGVAENQLFSLIGEKSFQAIKLYLTTHSERYSNKLELTGNVSLKEKPLTKEQKKIIRQALRRSSLNQYGKDK